MPPRSSTTAFRTNPDEEAALETEAKRLGVSKSDVVRMLVKTGLERGDAAFATRSKGAPMQRVYARLLPRIITGQAGNILSGQTLLNHGKQFGPYEIEKDESGHMLRRKPERQYMFHAGDPFQEIDPKDAEYFRNKRSSERAHDGVPFHPFAFEVIELADGETPPEVDPVGNQPGGITSDDVKGLADAATAPLRAELRELRAIAEGQADTVAKLLAALAAKEGVQAAAAVPDVAAPTPAPEPPAAPEEAAAKTNQQLLAEKFGPPKTPAKKK